MKKISSIFIFIIGILFSAAIFTFLLVLFIKNYHVSKEIYKSGDILNVGILQTLLAIITLGIGSVAFFNFLSMKKEFKRFKKVLKSRLKILEIMVMQKKLLIKN